MLTSDQRKCVICEIELKSTQKTCCCLSHSAIWGNINSTGEKARNWKGGRSLNSDGYWRIYLPEHPHACSSGYVYEHRYLVEQQLGRYLLPSEVVHHKNGIKTDNNLNNLELLNNQSEHCHIHNQGAVA